MMLPLKCSTDTACYKLVKVPDVPNKLPFMEYGEQNGCMGIGVSDKGHLYAAGGNIICLSYDVDELEKDEAHRKWVAENNFFRYDCEKNEWILLPPMPIVLFSPSVVVIDECVYVTGAEEMDGETPTRILRYSIPSKIWTVEASDSLFTATFVTKFHGNILIQGCISGEGPNLPGRYYLTGTRVEAVRLYKPDKRSWLYVDVDKLNCDDNFKSYYDIRVRKGICYLVQRSKGHMENKVNRVICDFDGDNPTMVLAEDIHEDEFDLDVHETFTFDKRKVGFELMDCHCESHVTKNQQMMQE